MCIALVLHPDRFPLHLRVAGIRTADNGVT